MSSSPPVISSTLVASGNTHHQHVVTEWLQHVASSIEVTTTSDDDSSFNRNTPRNNKNGDEKHHQKQQKNNSNDEKNRSLNASTSSGVLTSKYVGAIINNNNQQEKNNLDKNVVAGDDITTVDSTGKCERKNEGISISTSAAYHHHNDDSSIFLSTSSNNNNKFKNRKSSSHKKHHEENSDLDILNKNDDDNDDEKELHRLMLQDSKSNWKSTQEQQHHHHQENNQLLSNISRRGSGIVIASNNSSAIQSRSSTPAQTFIASTFAISQNEFPIDFVTRNSNNDNNNANDKNNNGEIMDDVSSSSCASSSNQPQSRSKKIHSKKINFAEDSDAETNTAASASLVFKNASSATLPPAPSSPYIVTSYDNNNNTEATQEKVAIETPPGTKNKPQHSVVSVSPSGAASTVFDRLNSSANSPTRRLQLSSEQVVVHHLHHHHHHLVITKKERPAPASKKLPVSQKNSKRGSSSSSKTAATSPIKRRSSSITSSTSKNNINVRPLPPQNLNQHPKKKEENEAKNSVQPIVVVASKKKSQENQNPSAAPSAVASRFAGRMRSSSPSIPQNHRNNNNTSTAATTLTSICSSSQLGKSTGLESINNNSQIRAPSPLPVVPISTAIEIADSSRRIHNSPQRKAATPTFRTKSPVPQLGKRTSTPLPISRMELEKQTASIKEKISRERSPVVVVANRTELKQEQNERVVRANTSIQSNSSPSSLLQRDYFSRQQHPVKASSVSECVKLFNTRLDSAIDNHQNQVLLRSELSLSATDRNINHKYNLTSRSASPFFAVENKNNNNNNNTSNNAAFSAASRPRNRSCSPYARMCPSVASSSSAFDRHQVLVDATRILLTAQPVCDEQVDGFIHREVIRREVSERPPEKQQEGASIPAMLLHQFSRSPSRLSTHTISTTTSTIQQQYLESTTNNHDQQQQQQQQQQYDHRRSLSPCPLFTDKKKLGKHDEQFVQVAVVDETQNNNNNRRCVLTAVKGVHDIDNNSKPPLASSASQQSSCHHHHHQNRVTFTNAKNKPHVQEWLINSARTHANQQQQQQQIASFTPTTSEIPVPSSPIRSSVGDSGSTSSLGGETSDRFIAKNNNNNSNNVNNNISSSSINSTPAYVYQRNSQHVRPSNFSAITTASTGLNNSRASASSLYVKKYCHTPSTTPQQQCPPSNNTNANVPVNKTTSASLSFATPIAKANAGVVSPHRNQPQTLRVFVSRSANK